MAVKGRLNNTGELQIAGELNERLPAVTNGLVAHFPFDSVAEGYGNNLDYNPTVVSGQWNIGGGSTATSDTFTFASGSWASKSAYDFYKTYYNLIDGATYEWSLEIESTSLSNLILCRNNTTDWNIGVVKEEKFVNGKVSIRWVQTGTGTNLHLGACGRADSQSIVQSAGTLKVKQIILKRIITPEMSNCTLTSDGIAVEPSTTNLIDPNALYTYVWEGRGVQSIAVIDNETYNGQPIYRLKLSLDTDAIRNRGAGGNGFLTNSVSYSLNTIYSASFVYRPVSHPDIVFNGYPSNNAGC